MRGKLRDKRFDAKRDTFKRDIVERRRATKRDNRAVIWLEEEDDELLLDEEAQAALVEVPQQKKLEIKQK